jgi:hypothetical protein
MQARYRHACWVSKEQFGYRRNNIAPSRFHNRAMRRRSGAAVRVGMVPAIVQGVRLSVYQSGRCVHRESFKTDSIRIGALSTNHLVLEGDGIYRLHAVIQTADDGDGFTIMAAGELRLNGVPVSRAKLRQGDRIQLGPYEVVVQSEQAARQMMDISSEHSRGELIYLLTKRKAV